jgi:hypothetical protein
MGGGWVEKRGKNNPAEGSARGELIQITTVDDGRIQSEKHEEEAKPRGGVNWSERNRAACMGKDRRTVLA